MNPPPASMPEEAIPHGVMPDEAMPDEATSDEATAFARLDAERGFVLVTLAGLRRGFQDVVEATLESNSDDEHDPEGSTIAFERSQLKSLIDQAQRHLDDIEDARKKVPLGRYGICERCGKLISAARLDARPMARTCIACAALRR